MEKSEVQKIVSDEIRRFLSDKIDGEIAKLVRTRSSKTHSEMVDIIRDAMTVVHKYMWTNKENWKNSIK